MRAESPFSPTLARFVFRFRRNNERERREVPRGRGPADGARALSRPSNPAFDRGVDGLVEGEKLDQFRPCAAQAALDGADLDVADLGRLLVGEAARADEGEHLALFRWKLGQRLAKILEVEMAFLVAYNDEPPRIGAVAVLNFASALAVVGIIDVAQDGEQPRAQARSGLEFVRLAPRPEQRLLDEVVGLRRRSRQRNRERPQD